MKSKLAGIRLDAVGSMGPRGRFRQLGRGEPGTQRGSRDQGNEHAERGDDCDGRPPSSSGTSAPEPHSAKNVQAQALDNNPNKL